jgi:hemolysin III
MKNNELLSSLTHFLGFLLSIAGLILLIVFASLHKTIWYIIGFSIFGASLILLYLANTLYHFFSLGSNAKKIFKKIDHSFIYILIAGTYTPICLTVLRGGWGWSIFGIIWGLARRSTFCRPY